MSKTKKSTKVKIQRPPQKRKRKLPTMAQVDGALQQMAQAIAMLEIQTRATYRAHASKAPTYCKCGHPVGFHLDDGEKIGGGRCIGYIQNGITGVYEPCKCERCDENRILTLGGN